MNAAVPATRVLLNEHVDRRGEYPRELEEILNLAGMREAQRSISAWPGYEPTPLVNLRGLAAELGVERLWYKDESHRFGLKSFKALGGAYAVFCLLRDAVSRARGDGTPVSSADLLAGRFRAVTEKIVVACASDGNHGRAVAWGARLFGCRCAVFLHERVSEARQRAIEAQGASVIRTRGNYDDSVRAAAERAADEGWTIVSDTSYPGYVQLPKDIMHGYSVITSEILRQLPTGELPTHVIVQAGVGGLAAAVAAHFWIEAGAARPVLIVVEPDAADCLYRSAIAGAPTSVAGTLETVMAGLSCGEPSLLAWEILERGADAFATLPDADVGPAMRLLAAGTYGDTPIVAGESAVAGLMLAMAAMREPPIAAMAGMAQRSRILVVGTEGDTDRDLYQNIIGAST